MMWIMLKGENKFCRDRQQLRRSDYGMHDFRTFLEYVKLQIQSTYSHSQHSETKLNKHSSHWIPGSLMPSQRSQIC